VGREGQAGVHGKCEGIHTFSWGQPGALGVEVEVEAGGYGAEWWLLMVGVLVEAGRQARLNVEGHGETCWFVVLIGVVSDGHRWCGSR
jgi:hypothetical protein